MKQVVRDSEWTKEKVIRELRRKKEELGKSPSKEDVDQSLAYVAKRLFGSWNNAKEEAGLETFEFAEKKWSKEKVIKKLKELADELGRPPVVNDDQNLAHAAQHHFGSWNKAKKAAGLEIFPFPDGRDWSKEEVIREMQDLADEVGRTPKKHDDRNLEQAARRYFGSWDRALKAAGVDSMEPREDAVLVRLGVLETREETLEEVLEQVKEVLPSNSADSIRKNAVSILRSVGPFPGYSVRKLVLGCVYLGCRFNGAVVFPDELAEGVSSEKIEGRKAIRRCAKAICRKTGASVPSPFKIQKVVEKFARDLGFGKQALVDAVKLGRRMDDKLNLSGRPRRSLGAAVLYIVACLHQDCDKLTRVEVGDACGVTGVSIGNNLGFLCGRLNREDLSFTPYPPVGRYSGVVQKAFVKEEDVKRSILYRMQKLADKLGRSPRIEDNKNLAQVVRKHFGSWNDAKRKAGLEVLKRGRSSSSKTEKEDSPLLKLLCGAKQGPLECEICGEKRIVEGEESPILVGPPVDGVRKIHRICHECYRRLLGRKRDKKNTKFLGEVGG